MSSLWTPSGGDPEPEQERTSPTGADADVGTGAGPAGGAAAGLGAAGPAAPDDAEVAEEMRRVRAELASTAVADLVANHAIGLWQLAVLHLTPEAGAPARLDEARLAIDAMAALVDGLGERLGDNAEALRDALAQLRLAFVQVSGKPADQPEPR